MKRADTLVLVNPVAGGGRARQLRPLTADYLAQQGWQADFAMSRNAEDFQRIAAEGAMGGYRYVVALGGDGSFHHTVEAALGHDVTLGFFPCGNGNDIAAGLGLPRDTMDAVHAFLRAEPHAIDLVRARFPDAIATRREAIYVGAGGMGLDAEAAQLANTKFRRWPGLTRYLAGALWAWRGFKDVELDAEIDGKSWRGRVLFAAVANCPSYGSGVRIAPAAKMDDGWLDVTFVREISLSRLLEGLPIVLRSGDIRWPELERFRCRHVTLRTNRPALVHGDGEILGESPVDFEILPGVVRVMLPRVF